MEKYRSSALCFMYCFMSHFSSETNPSVVPVETNASNINNNLTNLIKLQ